MDFTLIILVAISGILFTTGDVFLKYWSTKSSTTYIIIAFVFYILAGTFLAISFKRKEIAVATAISVCFNIVAISIVGFILFKETLGLKEIIGIGLAITAIIVLNI